MPESIINEPDLALDRHDGNVFVLTMRKAPENRINSAYAQKLIAAYNTVRKTLGPDSEGAVITKGNDAKFWCTVGLSYHPRHLYHSPTIQGPLSPPVVRPLKIDKLNRNDVKSNYRTIPVDTKAQNTTTDKIILPIPPEKPN